MNLSEATVLLVDDEPDLLEIFGLVFRSAGCRNLFTAKDGACALALLEGNPVDLMVTDVRMPTMDGITLVRRLAATQKPVPPIVLFSGFADIDRREMYALGVEAFLSKPLPPMEIIEVAERALADRSTLWLTPMTAPPKQSMHIQVDETEEAMGQAPIQLGCGGFSAHYPGPIVLGKISFRWSLSSHQPEVAGEGYVRWRSRMDDTVGVEFSFLDESCRAWLLQEIAERNPRSFIPSLI
jgi:CheY-like chemotaxis protein